MQNNWKYVTDTLRPMLGFQSAAESYKFTLANESVKEDASKSVANIVLAKARKHFSEDASLRSILETNGDVTKMEGYENLKLVLAELRRLTLQANEKQDLLNDLDTIVKFLETKKESIKKAFRNKSEASMFFYSSAVFALYHSATLCTLLVVEYWKDNANTWNTKIKHFGYARLSKDSMVGTAGNIASTIRSGHADNMLVKDQVANEGVMDLFGYNKGLTAIGVIAGVMFLIGIIRIVMTYTMIQRMKLANYLQAQSDFLAVNAKRNKNEGNDKVAAKQEVIVERLKKLAKAVDVNTQQASSAANQEASQPVTDYKSSGDDIM